MSTGSAQSQESGARTAPFRVLRELGKRAQSTRVATRGEGTGLVALQSFTSGERGASPEVLTLVERDARSLCTNWHPNVARVRNVDFDGTTLTIATEFIDGITLEELLSGRGTRAIAEPLLARILLDVLAGLQALHGLRDEAQTPLSTFHGELCPTNVVVGRDGVARLIAVFRPRPVQLLATSEALGYASPEMLAGEVDQDARADIYAVGVILWEALTGRRLYDEASPGRIAQRQREEDVLPPEGSLAEVAMRALSFDAGLRFRSAQEMAWSLRAHAETIAPGSAVAQFINEVASERIRARRGELEPGSTGRRRAALPLPAPSEDEALPAYDRTGARRRSLGEDVDVTPRPGSVTSSIPPVVRRVATSRPPLPPSVLPWLQKKSGAPRPFDSSPEFAGLVDAPSVGELDDGESVALDLAREVVVSPKSVRPSAPDMPQLLEPGEAPASYRSPTSYALRPASVPSRPSFASMGPLRIGGSANTFPEPQRRAYPLIAGIAALAILLLLGGVAVISRSPSATPAVAAPPTPATELPSATATPAAAEPPSASATPSGPAR